MAPEITQQEAVRIAKEIVAIARGEAPTAPATVCANCGKSHPGAVANNTTPRPSTLFGDFLRNTGGDNVPPPPSMEAHIRASRGLQPVTTTEPHVLADTSAVPPAPSMLDAIQAHRGGRR